MSLKKLLTEYLGCLLCGCKSQKSTVETERSQEIDKVLMLERKKRKAEVRLFLLGAAESGKSTFVKQMRIINDVKFTQEEMIDFKRTIHENVARGLRTLILYMDKLAIPFHDPQIGREAMDLVNNQHVNVSSTLFAKIWSDAGIKECFRRRSEFQLIDSTGYFLDNVDRLFHHDYIPTTQDILHARKTTTAVTEYKVPVKDVMFVFCDVGGQRSKRQKWLQLFSEDLNGVLFMASASEFDQKLREDGKSNRLQESIIIFRTMVNNEFIRKTAFILFLNKMDLLEEKIEYSDISDHFYEFAEGQEVTKSLPKGLKFSGNSRDVEDVQNFILSMFLQTVIRSSSLASCRKRVYHHFTTATDTKNIRLVFKSVRDSILRKNIDALMLE